MEKEITLHEEHKDWRLLFPFTCLKKAEELLRRKAAIYYKGSPDSARAVFELRRGCQYDVKVVGPQSYEEDWDSRKFSCTCSSRRSWSFNIGGRWHYSLVCPHEAALLMLWEREHGPWVFPEPPEAREARAREEERKAEEYRRKQEEKKEKERQKREEQRLRGITVPVDSFLPDPTRRDLFFDVKHAVQACETSQFCVQKATRLREAGAVGMETPLLSHHEHSGAQTLVASGTVSDPPNTRNVAVSLDTDDVCSHRCSCRAAYWYPSQDLGFCEHELALLSLLQEYVEKENPGDATDLAADSFFRELERHSSIPDNASAEPGTPRPKTIILSPKLTVDDGELSLSYKTGYTNGKAVILRSYRDFLRAAESRERFAASKTVSLDFSEADLTEESQPWLTFLQRRISETDVANARLSQSYYSTGTLKVYAQDTLAGAALDRFYEIAEGSSIDCQDKDRGKTGLLRIGHARARVALRSSRISNVNGVFLGVEVTGAMPRILKGSAENYILDSDSLSKITREEELALRPFASAADASGTVRFRVGKEKLAEFYYRVVPRLMQSPFVDFSDFCAEEVEALLPPEPSFTLRLDLDDTSHAITCLALVRYGEDKPCSLPCPNPTGRYRDTAQEERVLHAVKAFFPRYANESGHHWVPYSEDTMFQILSEGVAELSRFGTVEGSSSFERSALRPMPQLRVGVSVESGLLEIELLSRDISPEDLLAVLESYRQKKRFHRLSSGRFLSLAGDRQLSQLDRLSRGMDLSLEDAVHGGARLPMYRALYLDSLLEEHEALYANRDRSYRALIKNFKTIRDADYEVPEAQAEVLRPYQIQGYKWLRTLAEAGFGGILADEMGLGKTLQMISLIQALYDAGRLERCLVVCPASLVYNWQEEFRRFAPGISVEVMVGTTAARKKRIAASAAGSVCITSYDLLRQDIASYQELSFSLAVLDEAQYIKNQKASMTKAVKAVKARLRFALTGTPIENRLAELWSIFDFLMPGFLYSYPEFSRRLETPITRQKDPDATVRLRQMVAPFILRRLKAEVLKDLPPKLEEVRYTRFEEEQRKVYDGQVVRMKQLVLRSGDSGEDKLRILAELTRIRQICCDPSLLLEDYRGGSAKRSACIELIQTAVGGGHRMLVFSQFTSMLALLEQDLTQCGIPCFKLTGATTKEQRIKLVREFNEGGTPVFLISLKAGGTGLNLTGADMVIHYDPWWNLAAQNQATDRAHRIGQENQVTVYRIIVKDSIEERILALQEAKRDLAEAVLSGESRSLAALSTEELLALLG